MNNQQTYTRIREFLSDDELHERVGALAQALGLGSLDINGEFYRQLQKDVRLIDAAERGGIDLQRTRDIEQWAYFPDKKQAKRFARALVVSRKHHRAQVARFNGESWPVVVRNSSPLHLEAVARMTVSMVTLAAQHGGWYSGFEATIQRAPAVQAIQGEKMDEADLHASGITLRPDYARVA